MKTSIIVPVLNNMVLTQAMIDSVETYTPEEYEFIFVDNGSQDGINQWLKYNMKPNWRLIENERNEGFPRACNQGMAIADGDCILLLNTDVLVSPEWLKGLHECLNCAPDIGIVGPKSNFVSGAQLVTEGAYSNADEFIAFAKDFRKSFRGLYLPRYRVVGFCFLFKRELIDRIGYFDERFTPGNFEDDDYCLRALAAGYRNMICGDVFIHHHGTKSHDPSTYQAILDANQKKFEAKWDELTPKTVSAVMIVKDEEETLKRCLDALSPQVDEIIVVDTGSKDKTREIAGSYDKVRLYDFEWNDDFSEARNFANSRATGEWLFSVDADEVVTGLGDAMKKRVYPYEAVRVNTRNYTDNVRVTGWKPNVGEYPDQEIGSGWFGSEKIRLWRNHPKVCWEYPVHEVLENSVYYLGWRITTDYSIQVHHYGRLKDGYEYGHGSRYYDLLHKQFQSGKNDLRSLEQLATQAQGLEKWQDAINFWMEVLKIEPENSTAFLNLGHSYASLGNWPEAKKWSHKAWKANPEAKETSMNVAICEHMTGGDEDLAVKICDDLIAKHPLYPLPRGLLGAIQTLRANREEGEGKTNGSKNDERSQSQPADQRDA